VEFIQKFRQAYNTIKSTRKAIVFSYLDEKIIISDIDFSPVAELLASLYSPEPRGRKPRDPVCVLRSLILMVMLNETSITRWAKRLRSDEFLSVIAGWEPGKSPSVSTFYQFLYRLQDGPYKKKCSHIEKPSELDKGWHKRNFKKEDKKKKKEQKKEIDHQKQDSITQKLAEELLANSEQPRQNDLTKRLQDLLMELGVKPSIKKELIDPMELELCGDGSSIVSGARKQGKCICNCLKEKNIRKCDCHRLYKDPDADFGYDPYRDEYYYGDTMYQICYSSKGHDLPVNIIAGPASETDYTLSLKAYDSCIKTFREHDITANITAAIMDAGHDAMGNYFYFRQKDIPALIPLNSRGAKEAYRDNIKLSSRGIPLCKGCIEMRHISYNKTKMKHSFGCPVKRGTHRKGNYIYVAHTEECPLGALCSPDTKHGPVVSISSRDNPRLFPDIPRSSQKFKELYKLRTGTERSNAAKKEAYPFHRARLKSRAARLIRLYLIAIVEHRKAIYKEDTKGLSKEQIVELFENKI